ncbi:MAG: hypothetical protein II832_03835, partial [Synergistaceae bacterium]|nr:hypothetical protein [Synergistaceae bacterium]
MTKLYNLAVPTGHYKDRNGNDKSTWENIGSVWQNDEGHSFILLKACFNPAAIQRKEGSDSIVVNIFKPKNNDNFNGYSSDDTSD